MEGDDFFTLFNDIRELAKRIKNYLQ